MRLDNGAVRNSRDLVHASTKNSNEDDFDDYEDLGHRTPEATAPGTAALVPPSLVAPGPAVEAAPLPADAAPPLQLLPPPAAPEKRYPTRARTRFERYADYECKWTRP